MRNLITDVPGLKVGGAQDNKLKSGVTVLLADEPITASVAIHGGAPGTRDVALLAPEFTVEKVDALVLGGGSAFGLDAGSGAQMALTEMGRGFAIGSVRVPIVPTAILFDLLNGGDKNWGTVNPYGELGRRAVENADMDFPLGSHGAGVGATISGLKGGLGSASALASSGAAVGALVAVNALGQATVGDTAHFWAAPCEKNDEFGGLGFPTQFPDAAMELRTKADALAENANTTIGIVATDLALTKAELKRLAVMAHDGYARALWPAHTMLDGDLIFAVSTGKRQMREPVKEMIELGARAAETMARAIARGVYEAKTAPNDVFPTWKTKFANETSVAES